VPAVGKFGSVYARPGHRVLIDPKGNMIVRPTPLDLKLAQACKFCDSQPHPASHGILHQLLTYHDCLQTQQALLQDLCDLIAAFCYEG